MGALIDSRELDWDPHAESFMLLIVGSPALKISVYSKHISLSFLAVVTTSLFKAGRVAA